MKLLSIEGKFYAFLDTFWNMIKLNLMWWLFSLPIITVGCSTVAAYSVTLKMVENREGSVTKQFVQAFKANWQQGIPMGLITLFVSYAVYLNLQLFNHAEDHPLIFLFGAIFLGAVGLTHFTYAFPLSARYHNALLRTFRNSAAIAVRYFGHTLLLWLLLLVLIALFLFNSTLLFFGFLIGPACLFLTVSGFAVKLFRSIEKEGDA